MEVEGHGRGQIPPFLCRGGIYNLSQNPRRGGVYPRPQAAARANRKAGGDKPLPYICLRLNPSPVIDPDNIQRTLRTSFETACICRPYRDGASRISSSARDKSLHFALPSLSVSLSESLSNGRIGAGYVDSDCDSDSDSDHWLNNPANSHATRIHTTPYTSVVRHNKLDFEADSHYLISVGHRNVL